MKENEANRSQLNQTPTPTQTMGVCVRAHDAARHGSLFET